MSRELKPYPKYKDSGVKWIGEIPGTWEVSKIKYLVKFNELTLSENVSPMMNIQYIDIGSIDSTGNILNAENMKFEDAPSRARRILRKDDTIISTVRTYLRAIATINVDKKNLIGSTGFAVLTPTEKVNSTYLSFLLHTSTYIDQIVSRSTGVSYPAITSNELSNIECIMPDKLNQDKIAIFLMKKTSEIDALIADKEKLISLLEEKRQAVITETVTKGLDPNVKMKDSGIEWIGEIPVHWEVIKIRFLGKLQNGISKGGAYFGKGDPFVSYSNVYNNMIIENNTEELLESTDQEKNLYSVEKGDVFFTRTSETVEEIAIASTCVESIENATFAGFLIRFRPNKNYLYDGFSKYYFRSHLRENYFIKEMNLVTRASLNQTVLKNYQVILPPLGEQVKIGEYLDEKNSYFTNLIQIVSSQISKLKEYRESLIYEAVTGKI